MRYSKRSIDKKNGIKFSKKQRTVIATHIVIQDDLFGEAFACEKRSHKAVVIAECWDKKKKLGD